MPRYVLEYAGFRDFESDDPKDVIDVFRKIMRYDKENLEVMKKITQGLSSVVVSKGNSLEDMFNGFRNNYLNIDAIMESNSIKEIKNKYEILESLPIYDLMYNTNKSTGNNSGTLSCRFFISSCAKLLFSMNSS